MKGTATDPDRPRIGVVAVLLALAAGLLGGWAFNAMADRSETGPASAATQNAEEEHHLDALRALTAQIEALRTDLARREASDAAAMTQSSPADPRLTASIGTLTAALAELAARGEFAGLTAENSPAATWRQPPTQDETAAHGAAREKLRDLLREEGTRSILLLGYVDVLHRYGVPEVIASREDGAIEWGYPLLNGTRLYIRFHDGLADGAHYEQ